MLATLLAAIGTQTLATGLDTASTMFIVESVNDAALVSQVYAGDKGIAVLRAQILLDRARFFHPG